MLILVVNWYDYGARFYDPALGRWNSVDMLGEFYYSFSPYNYVLNNPTLYIDPFGLDVWSTSDPEAIAAFIRQVKTTGSARFGGENWDHISDDEFLNSGDLSYSDESGSFFYTKGYYNNEEAGIKCIKFPSLRGFPDDNMLSRDEGTIASYKPNFWGALNENYLSKNFIGRATYQVFDDAFLYTTGLVNGQNNAMHLDRSGVEGSEYLDAGLNTLTNFVPIGSFGKYLGIQKKVLNAAEFSVEFKGQSVLKGSAASRGLFNREFNHVIRMNNSFSIQYRYLGYGSILSNGLNE